VLHWLEKNLIKILRRVGKPLSFEEAASLLNRDVGTVAKTVQWLKEKELVEVEAKTIHFISLGLEGEILKEVNKAGIGPRTIAVKDTVIAMEYIRGEFFSEWLKARRVIDRNNVRMVVKGLLGQCWTLDNIGIDHGELSDAKKHVLIDQQGTPRIIDFESASRERTCRNLVSIAGYLFFKKKIADCLRVHLSWDDSKLKELLKDYKRLRSQHAYEKILEELRL